MSWSWLEKLSTAECRDYLRSVRLGRVGLSIDALPVILPVMFVVHDDSVWFLTEPGTKLQSAVNNAIVAFEVDGLEAGVGWSVLVIGRSVEIDDQKIFDELRHVGLRTDARGPRKHLVRILIEHISGRSFSNRESDHWVDGYL
jgi:uncharacterized protein